MSNTHEGDPIGHRGRKGPRRSRILRCSPTTYHINRTNGSSETNEYELCFGSVRKRHSDDVNQAYALIPKNIEY